MRTHTMIARLALLTGAAVLAWHPLVWLAGTWTDPSYASHGWLVALAVLGLGASSALTPRRGDGGRRVGLGLLAATALLRAAGEVLGVNVIGAAALVVDVYALGLLLGLADRRRPLSPAWLAVLFAFSLPVERIVQRTIGFGLQQLSAAGACDLLALGPDEVRCEGVRILLAGRDVLVDLPCSGARGLLMLTMLYCALAAVHRPGVARAVVGLVVTLASAFVANVARIVALALGVVHGERFGLDVMAAPWHDAIGIAALGLGAAPVVGWAMLAAGRARTPRAQSPRARAPGAAAAVPAGALPFAFLAVAVGVLILPARPVDVARPVAALSAPARLGPHAGSPEVLDERERAYFTRYGGGAARARYGAHGLLLVRTSAPLRHLHAPDECLRGSGHRVRYLGQTHAILPTALYRSSDPSGREWRIAVTFVSDRGETVSSVAQAVWLWLQRPGSRWTMVQRISPWSMPRAEAVAFDAAVARALDLGVSVRGVHAERRPGQTTRGGA